MLFDPIERDLLLALARAYFSPTLQINAIN